MLLKSPIFNILALIILFVASSCKQELVPEISVKNTMNMNANKDFNIFVDYDTVESYIHNKTAKTKSENNVEPIISPYLSEEGDTLMYIVNYGNDDGWTILSADARTPAVLAEGEKGSFSLEEGGPGVRLWINNLAQKLEIIRHSSNSSLVFSEEEISENIQFWSMESQIPIRPNGNWRIITTTETLVYDYIDHMVPEWDQWRDYNHYCPYQSGGSSDDERVPAGCVAVAGSQMLYYLHNKIGVPASMVSTGYCIGEVNNYSRGFSDPNSTIWELMDTTYHTSLSPYYAEALLIGYVGALVQMHYRDSSSWALPSNLISNVFNYYGISCSQGSYDQDIVTSSLDAHMPVIVTATDLLIPVDFDIHCFVIDGYKKTYLKRTHYHFWDPDEPDPYLESIVPPGPGPSYYTYTYTTPTITAIKINWGWWTQWRENNPLNDGWYTLTDDWLVVNSGEEYTYNHNRNMIYGFSVSE